MRVEYSPEFVSRFWQKVDRSGGPNACWPWRGAIGLQGYGVLSQRRRPNRPAYDSAHRVAFEITYGMVLPGFYVCHHCDRRECANPAHLFVGLAADNNHDMMRKGRYVGFHAPRRVLRGTQKSHAKLNDEAVRAIRAAIAGGALQREVAAVYGVGPHTISNVVRRTNWKHVED